MSLIKLISHTNIWMKQTHSHAFFLIHQKAQESYLSVIIYFFSFLSFFEMYQHLQFIISFIFIFCLNVHSMYYYTICKKKIMFKLNNIWTPNKKKFNGVYICVFCLKKKNLLWILTTFSKKKLHTKKKKN